MSMNTTATFVNTFNGMSFEPIAIIISISIGVLIISLAFMPIFQRFQYAINKLSRIFLLTLKGGGITLTGYGIYWGILSLSKFTEFINFEPILILYGLGGFTALTLLGYGGEKVWNKIMENYHTLRAIIKESESA